MFVEVPSSTAVSIKWQGGPVYTWNRVTARGWSHREAPMKVGPSGCGSGLEQSAREEALV